MWRSLVAHLHGVQGVEGSNPFTPTTKQNKKASGDDFPAAFFHRDLPLNNILFRFFGLMFRAVLLVMGLVFFASLMVATLVLLALWAVRAVWARLMGRPVQPWVFQFKPKAHWSHFNRTPGWGRTSESGEVIDIESREIKTPDKRLKE